jgi:hypothetical protein
LRRSTRQRSEKPSDLSGDLVAKLTLLRNCETLIRRKSRGNAALLT